MQRRCAWDGNSANCSALKHISYPHATQTVVIHIWGFRRTLPAGARVGIEAVVGPFDVSLVEG